MLADILIAAGVGAASGGGLALIVGLLMLCGGKKR